MADNVRCKIDTEVLGRANGIVLHFVNSIRNIQKNIDYYLRDVSNDFQLQLDAIALLKYEAEKEEKKKRIEKENAKDELNKAIKEIAEANLNYENSQECYYDVKSDVDIATKEKDKAYAKMKWAEKEQREAYDDQQEAWIDCKEKHIITHDEFERIRDIQEDAKIALKECREEFNEKKAIFDEEEARLRVAEAHRNAAEDYLKTSVKQKKKAERDLHVADERLEQAVKTTQKREANLKHAKEIVLTFECWKDDYYHEYYFEDNKSCNVILNQLCDDMGREFGKAMDEIEEAVNRILRCSLRADASYDESRCIQPSFHQKSWEEDHRIRENLKDNMVKLNREMKRPEYERPDYTECCPICGRLLMLCNCPENNIRRSLDE